jgi:hypothetical protein
MFKFILVFIILFLQACASNSTSVSGPLLEDTEAKGNNSFQLEQPIIVLDRRFGECFGQCPVYKISIYDTGKVVFEGEKNVKTKGLVESKLDRSQLEQLIHLFENSQFFKLKDKYVRGENCSNPVLSDSPFVFISYSDGKIVKRVSHYHGCVETTNPSEAVNRDLNILYKLEESVDKSVNSKQWIK